MKQCLRMDPKKSPCKTILRLQEVCILYFSGRQRKRRLNPVCFVWPRMTTTLSTLFQAAKENDYLYSIFLGSQRKRRFKPVCFVWPVKTTTLYTLFQAAKGKRRLYPLFFGPLRENDDFSSIVQAAEEDDNFQSFSIEENKAFNPLFNSFSFRRRLKKTTTFAGRTLSRAKS